MYRLLLSIIIYCYFVTFLVLAVLVSVVYLCHFDGDRIILYYTTLYSHSRPIS